MQNSSAYKEIIKLRRRLQSLNTSRTNLKTEGFANESKEDGNIGSLMRIRSTKNNELAKSSPYCNFTDQTDPF